MGRRCSKKKCSNLSQRATGFPIPSSTRQGGALASNIPALGTVAVWCTVSRGCHPVQPRQKTRILGFYAPTGAWSHCGKLWRLVDMKVSCVSLLTAGLHAQKIKRQTCYQWQKEGAPWQWHIFCGISSLHPFVALVRCIRYGKFARFTDYLVCLFWPQVLTPSRGSRSWWINVCKNLFWLAIYCLLSLN